MRIVGTATLYLPEPGHVDHDDWNQTSLSVFGPRGGWVVPAHGGTMQAVAAGDTLQLSIPSGALTVTVHAVSVGPHPGWDGAADAPVCQIVSGNAAWDGRYRGLVTGLSGLGDFEFRASDDAPVHTSAWPPAPVPWWLCQVVHDLSDRIAFFNEYHGSRLDPAAIRAVQTRLYQAIHHECPGLFEHS